VGVILVDKFAEGAKVLMVRRKDTYGYVDFLRGKLDFSETEQLAGLIDEMTLYEKDRILEIKTSSDIEELRKIMWGDFKLQFRREEYVACTKIIDHIARSTRTGVGRLTDLVNRSETAWCEPEWGFPKGKREYRESDMKCALREFEEETGLSKSDITVVKNIMPIEEIYVGTDNRPYKHKYFIAVLNKRSSPARLDGFQSSEIGDMAWIGLEEAVAIMRPDNIEKTDIIRRLSELMGKYKVLY
jgi:8-oxo-dGTP pyrophosphatase MutT (NUDIX family)